MNFPETFSVCDSELAAAFVVTRRAAFASAAAASRARTARF